MNTTDGITNSVFAQEQKFTATLSDQEEVPPTNSQATGMSGFTGSGRRFRIHRRCYEYTRCYTGAHSQR